MHLVIAFVVALEQGASPSTGAYVRVRNGLNSRSPTIVVAYCWICLGPKRSTSVLSRECYNSRHGTMCLLSLNRSIANSSFLVTQSYFFLEEVRDKSLERQVVAGAWRMGTRGHVVVDTLVSKDSVESMIADLQENLAWQERNRFDVDIGGDGSRSLLAPAMKFQMTKQFFWLKNAKVIKPHVGYLDNNQTMKRKLVEYVSPDAEAAHKPNDKITTRARVQFSFDKFLNDKLQLSSHLLKTSRF